MDFSKNAVWRISAWMNVHAFEKEMKLLILVVTLFFSWGQGEPCDISYLTMYGVSFNLKAIHCDQVTRVKYIENFSNFVQNKFRRVKGLSPSYLNTYVLAFR